MECHIKTVGRWSDDMSGEYRVDTRYIAAGTREYQVKGRAFRPAIKMKCHSLARMGARFKGNQE
jgi:hypothetical protein